MKPDESKLVEYISGDDPKMPLNGEPLSPEAVHTIRTWIAQGANDDSPPAVGARITPENPPVYSSPPVVTSMDYSPDGKLLAVSMKAILLEPNAAAYKVLPSALKASAVIWLRLFPASEAGACAPSGRLKSTCGFTSTWRTP